MTSQKKKKSFKSNYQSSIGLPSIFFKNKSVLTFKSKLQKLTPSEEKERVLKINTRKRFSSLTLNRIYKNVTSNEYFIQKKFQAAKAFESMEKNLEIIKKRDMCIEKLNSSLSENSSCDLVSKISFKQNDFDYNLPKRQKKSVPNNHVRDMEFTLRDETFFSNPFLFEHFSQSVQREYKPKINNVNVCNVKTSHSNVIHCTSSSADYCESFNPNNSVKSVPPITYKTKSISELLSEIDNYRLWFTKNEYNLSSLTMNKRFENIKKMLGCSISISSSVPIKTLESSNPIATLPRIVSQSPDISTAAMPDPMSVLPAFNIAVTNKTNTIYPRYSPPAPIFPITEPNIISIPITSACFESINLIKEELSDIPSLNVCSNTFGGGSFMGVEKETEIDIKSSPIVSDNRFFTFSFKPHFSTTSMIDKSLPSPINIDPSKVIPIITSANSAPFIGNTNNSALSSTIDRFPRNKVVHVSDTEAVKIDPIKSNSLIDFVSISSNCSFTVPPEMNNSEGLKSSPPSLETDNTVTDRHTLERDVTEEVTSHGSTSNVNVDVNVVNKSVIGDYNISDIDTSFIAIVPQPLPITTEVTLTSGPSHNDNLMTQVTESISTSPIKLFDIIGTSSKSSNIFKIDNDTNDKRLSPSVVTTDSSNISSQHISIFSNRDSPQFKVSLTGGIDDIASGSTMSLANTPHSSSIFKFCQESKESCVDKESGSIANINQDLSKYRQHLGDKNSGSLVRFGAPFLFNTGKYTESTVPDVNVGSIRQLGSLFDGNRGSNKVIDEGKSKWLIESGPSSTIKVPDNQLPSYMDVYAFSSNDNDSHSPINSYSHKKRGILKRKK